MELCRRRKLYLLSRLSVGLAVLLISNLRSCGVRKVVSLPWVLTRTLVTLRDATKLLLETLRLIRLKTCRECVLQD